MKRILCTLLVALMLASMVVVPMPTQASDAEVTPIDTAELCSCGCEKKLSQISWTLWDPNNAVNSVSGHYYLAEDYAQDKAMEVKPNVRIVLDLRGHTLTQATENTRLFKVEGYVAVIDTVGSGRILSKPGQSGSAVYIRLDTVAMNEALDGTFAMYNCAMIQTAGSKPSSNGGLIFLEDNVNFKAFGARLMGASVSTHGGAIYAQTATTRIEMTNSSIIDCSANNSGGAIATSGHITLDNCHFSGNTAKNFGGNIFMNGNGTSLTIKNRSVIENGVANSSDRGGGNIFDNGSATVTISDSTIRNGYTAAVGGNISFGSGSYTLTNTTVTGGVAKGDGANLYSSKSAARVTLDSCSISGDVSFGSGKLTLKGNTKIGLNNNGLKLLNSTTVITATELSGDAEIYIDAQGTFTGTGVNSDYFKPALRTTLSTANGCLKGTQTTGATAGYCPHCGEQVSWTAFSGTGSGHFYLSKDTSITTPYQITGDVVLDLDGYDITSTDRAFTVAKGGALTLLDRKGGSLVTGSGNADSLGGVISNAGAVNIYKGSYTYAADTAKPLTSGGVIYATGSVDLYGGFFDGSAFHRTEEGCNGGAIYLAEDSGSFTMSAGRIVGGTAYTAGGVYLGANNTVTVTGGSITGGTAAKSAGNLALAGANAKRNGVASISGLSLTDGTAQSGEGGNMVLYYYKQSPMTDCYIAGGTSQSSKGGNLYFGTCSYMTLTDCMILNGTASTGGNLHNNSNAAVITLVDCLVTGGSAANGGNMYLQNGLITLQGGEYTFGAASKNGGNINNTTGALDDDCLQIQKNADGKAPVIAKGSATAYGGNIFNNGKLTLDAAGIYGGQANSGSDLYHNSGNNILLTVGAGLTGNIYTVISSDNLGDGVFGAPISKMSATALNAELILEDLEGTPHVCLSEGQLYVGSATVKTTDGNEVWYRSNAAALDACPADGWIKLYSTAPLVLTKDCFVDLAGKTATVSGNYTLYGMDSSGDDYSDAAGSSTLSGATAATFTDAPNGYRYVAITSGDSVSYHRLDMQLTTASIRPSDCGIYYSGTWGCDSVLAAQIESYGIAVSLSHMPKTDLERDDTCLYSSYEGSRLVSGATKTGVLIKNIMKSSLSASQNVRRGEMPIYATGYVKLTTGAVYTGDRTGAEDDVAYSLRTTMERMDSLIAADPSLFLSDTVHNAREFRAQWENRGMGSWTFEKLSEPEDDGVLKIMILGSSRSVNTFRLLYEVFKDQMPDQEFVFGIMYYSGCSMTMHKNFIQDNAYVYDYYCNDSGRWKITSGVNMDTGLYAHNWDVIFLQAGTGDTANQMNLSTRNFLKDYIDDRMIDPYELWWHSTWFNSTDPDLYTPPKTAEDAAAVDQVAQLKETNEAAVNYVLDDPMFAGHIASGTPVMYALREKNVPESKLFRDHTHLYDYGCLLVGYSFYAQFTGNPVTQINLDEIPDYLRIREHVALGDVPVTEEDKQIIIDTVNYVLEDPWGVPWTE